MNPDNIEIGKLTDREILVLLAQGHADIKKQLMDHSAQIRALETFRNVLVGGGSVVAAVGAALKVGLSIKHNP